MRKPTKVALEYLAKTMVDNGSYITTRGTGDFINEAVKLHKKTESYVTVETIKKHESDLEKMCRAELSKVSPKKVLEEKEVWQRLYDSSGYELQEWEAIELISSQVILAKAKEIEEESLQIKKVMTPVKDWSMFFEGEDGLRVKRGEYKGLYVNEIDAQRWAGCAIGWSRYQLKQNEELGANRPGALTEDDKNVFLDIISGKDV